MTTAVSLPQPVRSPSHTRPTIVSTVLAVAAITVAVLVLWQPWGGRDQMSYADIAPHRDAAWLGTIADGLGVATIGVALGLAVCLLTPARGAAWANVGAVLSTLGGAAYGTGVIAFGTFAWYVTDTAALPASSGTAFLTYATDHPAHLLGLSIAGFLLTTVASLVLMVALWRSRSVPRWFPIGYTVLTIAGFVVGGVALNVVQAVQTLSLLVVAFYTTRATR